MKNCLCAEGFFDLFQRDLFLTDRQLRVLRHRFPRVFLDERLGTVHLTL